MTDKNNLNKRTVNNQLFSASVTGATIDEFSHNAMLYPVLDLNSTTNTSNGPFENSNLNKPPEQQFQTVPIQSTTAATFGSPLSPPSVAIPNETPIGLPPKGQTNNLYRRSTTKKVTYAQIPGLVSSHHQSHEFPLSTNAPQPFQPTQIPPPSTSSVTNYFQPIPNESITAIPSENRNTSSGILIPESSSASLLLETNIDTPKNFFRPSSIATYPQTSSALLTPTVSSSLITDTGISQSYDEITNLSNTSVPFVYGNELSSAINTMGLGSQIYRPVYHHWFYKRILEGRTLWDPFSMRDSLALEEAFTSSNLSPETVVATNGGRFDVNILRRERYPVYWADPPTEVRRCSWFSKSSTDGRFIPYEENLATMLEEEFRTAFEKNEWHRVIQLANGDSVTFHGPDVLVLMPPNQSVDAWGGPKPQLRPLVLKRGMDEFDIDYGEPLQVDHLIFVVHGIGSYCDLKFRSVQEVVDEFRTIALQLVQSHYHSSCETNITNRIEILPISWHESLHSDDTGIDKKLKNITLESIPRLRDFTNSTLLDVLFYASPVYCQTITSSVTSDLNRIYKLFQQRNPSFHGGVSLVGHSLGSLILFDILSHEVPEPHTETDVDEVEDDILPDLKTPSTKQLNRRISYMLHEAGTGQPKLIYPHLKFKPTAFFALGSPIGMFITVRGLDKLGTDFALPTCSSFYNIFHPYDPVAYRIEPLLNPELVNLKPVLVPHHKGRKRMHLELKEAMYRVSTDLKQKVVDSMKYTWNTIFQMAMFGRQDTNQANIEAEVDRVLEEQMAKEVNEESYPSHVEDEKTDLNLGILNDGHRIDYVLQEAPFEIFNEYLFAVTSHVCYWESEDTVLFILKELYATMGIAADGTQQSSAD